MEDIQSTRRRKVNSSSFVLSLPTGGNDSFQRTIRRTTTTTAATTTTEEGTFQSSRTMESSKSKPKSRKRKRKRDSKEDPPFWILVVQVGIVVFIVFVGLHYLYRWISPTTPTFLQEGDSNYYDDDDDDAAQYQPARTEDIEKQVEQQQPSIHVVEDQQAKLIKLLELHDQKEQQDQNEQKQQLQQQQEELNSVEEPAITAPPTPLPYPTFELGELAPYDTFGLLELFQKQSTEKGKSIHNPSFWQAVQRLHFQFVETYGNENIARMLLDKGLSTFVPPPPSHTANTWDAVLSSIPSDIRHTACRMRQAQQEHRPFNIAFGGYSVTAGRGNYFSQSFPFVMKELLDNVFQLAGLEWTVRNAAIGGCPAFPYGWCMKNFWGSNPDVVSWDYSMNEAGGVPEGLEAYVRHVLAMTSSNSSSLPPKLIVKDTHMATQRRQVLATYLPLLLDPVVIHTEPAVQPFLQRPEQSRPIGFQEWRKFGAPYGAPGQAYHHPALKEHAFIGWILSMHFLAALQVFVAAASSSDSGDDLLSCPTSPFVDGKIALPPPVSGSINNITMAYPSILFGAPTPTTKQGEEPKWFMNSVHCRTTFQPILDDHGKAGLTSIVVSGTVAENLDVLLPKSHMFYDKGWTMDMSEDEKKAKKQLSLYKDSLGFIDSKQAYYGIFESGVMQLLVPYEQEDKFALMENPPQVGGLAKEWFQSVVVCQVNEKRDSGACNSATDVGYRIGSFDVTVATLMPDAGALYLGKKVCTKLTIPDNAVLTSRRQIQTSKTKTTGSNRNNLQVETWSHTSIANKDDQVGVVLEIFVTNQHINNIKQACSVSHVIWEQIQKKDKQGQ